MTKNQPFSIAPKDMKSHVSLNWEELNQKFVWALCLASICGQLKTHKAMKSLVVMHIASNGFLLGEISHTFSSSAQFQKASFNDSQVLMPTVSHQNCNFHEFKFQCTSSVLFLFRNGLATFLVEQFLSCHAPSWPTRELLFCSFEWDG